MRFSITLKISFESRLFPFFFKPDICFPISLWADLIAGGALRLGIY
jgi:hypothetical protein